MINDFTKWESIFSTNKKMPEKVEILVSGSSSFLFGFFMNTPATWNLAGWLNGQVSLPFKPTIVKQVPALLNYYTFIYAPEIDRLIFNPVRWLEGGADIVVLKYTGEEEFNYYG